MFTEPHVLARDHLEVALLILTECCPRSDRTADLVAAAIRSIDVKLAAELGEGAIAGRNRAPRPGSERPDAGA
jgi:hypothetical protein